MQRAFKYRIYPNKSQREALDNIFEFCRFTYNCALEERISYYKINKNNKDNKSLSYKLQCRALPEIKQSFPSETKNIHSQTLQQVLKTLDSAYSNFFKRLKLGAGKAGFPRFKNKDRFKSILFPQSDFNSGGIKMLNDNYINIHKIGKVKINYHRPFQGRCKQVRITKNKSNQYFIVLSCQDVSKNVLTKTGKEIGIDLGLSSFITTNDGTKFHHPKPYKTSLEKMQFLQRKLQKLNKGSKLRKETKRVIAKTHLKISNIREDFQNKIANKLILDNDKICMEDLNIQGMLKSSNNFVKNMNITEASWGSFKHKLIYKAESAGKLIVLVDPRNTSKMCSNCGNIKETLLLKDRTYKCEACGFAIDRDHNAAINIYKRGL